MISPSQIDKLFDLPLIDVPLSPPPSKNINASATLDESTVNIDDQQRPANHIPITPAPTAPHDPTMLYTSVHFAHDPLTWNDASTYFMTPYSSCKDRQKNN